MSALPHSSRVGARPSSTTVEGLGPRRVRRRLAATAGAALVLLALVLAVPGLVKLRVSLENAAPGWVLAGIALEVLSALSYVVIFRSVFCERMGWRLSYQIGMAEQSGQLAAVGQRRRRAGRRRLGA
jgi:hypothetical protein